MCDEKGGGSVRTVTVVTDIDSLTAADDSGVIVEDGVTLLVGGEVYAG